MQRSQISQLIQMGSIGISDTTSVDQLTRQRMTFGHHNRVALSNRNSHQNYGSGLVFSHSRVRQRGPMNGKQRVSLLPMHTPT